MTFGCVKVFNISPFLSFLFIAASFSYCIGNQLILGQGGSNYHKNVYHTLSVLKKIINIRHFALAKSVLQKEILNLNFEWIVKGSNTGYVQFPGAEGDGS